MSDNYTIHHRRKTARSFGTARKMKYVKISTIILLCVFAIGGYLVFSSGVLSENGPEISGQMMNRINTERAAAHLPQVKWDAGLSNQAGSRSTQMKVAPRAFSSSSPAESPDAEDTYMYPKLSYVLSAFSLEAPVYEKWNTEDSRFHKNLMNPDFRNIGIGIDSDGYNYYMVALWK